MLFHARSELRTLISQAVVMIGSALLLAPIGSAMGLGQQRDMHAGPELGLEIRLTSTTVRVGGPRRGESTTRIPGRLLKISNSQLPGVIESLQVETEIEGDDLRVTLSLIYESGDKTEKVGEPYLIRAGESIRTSELERFGIEPVEIKAIDTRPVVLKPGEGPRITNSTSLEVEKLELHFDVYYLWLKNKSDKNVVAYEISTGRGGTQRGEGNYGRGGPALAAGAIGRLLLHHSEIGDDGIAIRLAVFDDGTFEGDSKKATQYLAKAEGVRIQSPSVLRRIEETMQVDDSDLRTAFVKLESELWLIPEALDKPSSIQYLKTKFPAEDEKSLSALYEVFKGGLYDGRNIALSSLGETLRTVQPLEERSQYGSAVKTIRKTLEQLKETFGKIISATR